MQFSLIKNKWALCCSFPVTSCSFTPNNLQFGKISLITSISSIYILSKLFLFLFVLISLVFFNSFYDQICPTVLAMKPSFHFGVTHRSLHSSYSVICLLLMNCHFLSVSVATNDFNEIAYWCVIQYVHQPVENTH